MAPSIKGSLLTRFQDAHGSRLLIEVLRSHRLFGSEQSILDEVARISELREIPRGAEIIAQDGADNDLFLILAGEFSVSVNGRPLARRGPGQHVGEMALIDGSARRSASVIALTDSVVAKITEPDFTALANKHPQLWRSIAVELAARLRQRNALVQERREVPVMFIGSSRESLPIAQELQSGLSSDPIKIRLWSEGIFGPSSVPIEVVEAEIRLADFAALLLGPDDKVISRTAEHDAPRDNVVFEIGAFLGAIGRHRTIIIKPQGLEIKIPTDLLGVIPSEYVLDTSRSLADSMAPVCDQIRKVILEKGPI